MKLHAEAMFVSSEHSALCLFFHSWDQMEAFQSVGILEQRGQSANINQSIKNMQLEQEM